jgi:hypothetical protein
MHSRAEEDGFRGADVNDVLQATSRNKNEFERTLKNAVPDGVCLENTIINSIYPSNSS